MLYRFKFEVDDGVSYRIDNAIVEAQDPDEAEEKLKKFINCRDSETCVSEIFDVSPYKGDIFTGQHGFTV